MTSATFRNPCIAVAILALVAMNSQAQPTFGNPSPTAGSSTSDKANAAAGSPQLGAAQCGPTCACCK